MNFCKTIKNCIGDMETIKMSSFHIRDRNTSITYVDCRCIWWKIEKISTEQKIHLWDTYLSRRTKYFYYTNSHWLQTSNFRKTFARAYYFKRIENCWEVIVVIILQCFSCILRNFSCDYSTKMQHKFEIVFAFEKNTIFESNTGTALCVIV